MATELYAPMVGKVVDFLVEPGAEIEEDEPVLMLEALKLKMPVVSPCDGTIKEFCVKKGDDVESDTVLAIIDDDE
jgi:biotin carboxyl carrier protein